MKKDFFSLLPCLEVSKFLFQKPSLTGCDNLQPYKVVIFNSQLSKLKREQINCQPFFPGDSVFVFYYQCGHIIIVVINAVTHILY